MIDATNRTAPVRPLDITAAGRAEERPSGTEFASLLQNAIGRVESTGEQAGRAVDEFLSGGKQDLHSVALAGQKAALQFELALQIRNKIVHAYQEVMRMQL